MLFIISLSRTLLNILNILVSKFIIVVLNFTILIYSGYIKLRCRLHYKIVKLPLLFFCLELLFYLIKFGSFIIR